MSRISIALLTYNRRNYAEKTIRSTLAKIVTSHHVSVHIASDGDPAEYIDYLAGVIAEYPIVKGSITATNACRGGYGRNYNMMTHSVHGNADFVLPLEDDWELTRPLYLDELVDVLDVDPDIASIRLGYLGYTQQVKGWVKKIKDSAYLILDPDSAEPHVFSGHPRLETVGYQRRVGLWPEGLNPGETEFSVAHNVYARIGVAWPMDLVKTCGDMFAHIGTIKSY